MGRAWEDMGRDASFGNPQDYGALNNHLSTTLHVFSHLVQRASQTSIVLACINWPLSIRSFSIKQQLSIHPSSLKSTIPFTYPPSDQRFHSSSINSYTHAHILSQFNRLNPSSSINLTMSPIPFNHSNSQFNMFVLISLSSSPWQTHLPPPNPPSKLQQHRSNWERTSM